MAVITDEVPHFAGTKISILQMLIFLLILAFANGRATPWLSPCGDVSHRVLPAIAEEISLLIRNLSGDGVVSTLSTREIARRLEDTLAIIQFLKAQIQHYFGDNYEHMKSLRSREMISYLISEGTQAEWSTRDLILIKVYETLTRVAVYVSHLKASIEANELIENKAGLIRALTILEHGGFFNDQVITGGIYPIMCNIYKELSEGGSRQFEVDIETSTPSPPQSTSHLNDQFYQILLNMARAIEILKRRLNVDLAE